MKLGKTFFFHFGNSFSSQENHILRFYVFEFHDVIKCLDIKQEIQSVNEIWSVYVILQKKKFYQKILQKLQPEN